MLKVALNTINLTITGADPGFQVRGAHLKKLRRAEGGANIFGVFRVKNHAFTHKIIFFPILGVGAPGAPPPPWIRPCLSFFLYMAKEKSIKDNEN
jgi:hypothetical protein